MPYNPHVHDRRSIRLPGYDYRSEGGYFVTLVTTDRECAFGDVERGHVRLSSAGQMVVKWWRALPSKFAVRLGEFILMPNHVHGVVEIAREQSTPGANESGEPAGSMLGPALGDIIRWFKTMTTNEYIRGVEELGWEPFDKRLWQRNYYEHIVRGESDLLRINRYIRDNPRNWPKDDENPSRIAGPPRL